MRRTVEWPLIIALFLFLAAGVLGLLSTWHLDADGLSIDQSTIDFGEVEPGSIQSTVVRLSNKSSDRLSILEVTSGCTCTIAQPDDKQLNPGTQTSLKLEWHVPKERGAVASTVAVVWEDGRASDTSVISLHASVRPTVLINPLSLTFNEDGTERIFLETPGESFLSAKTTHHAFEARLDDPRTVSINFSRQKWYFDGFNPDVVLTTTSRTEPTVRVPLVVATSLSGEKK